MRDYFHGKGKELTPEQLLANPPAPIRRTHVSRAFRSRATGLMMVAFSTPVWSGKPRAPGSRVLGVLATTVTANRFNVLELDTGEEAAEEPEEHAPAAEAPPSVPEPAVAETSARRRPACRASSRRRRRGSSSKETSAHGRH